MSGEINVGLMDTRLPLAVKDTPLFDPIKDTEDAYTLGTEKLKFDQAKQEKSDADSDRMWIQQYLKSGGDLYTPEGFEKAASDLKGKLSPKSYTNLVELGQKSKKVGADITDALAQADERQLEVFTKQHQAAGEIFSSALDSYDKIRQAKGDQAAGVEFDAIKKATLDYATQLKSQDGKPLFRPEELQHFAKMDPETMRGSSAFNKWRLDAALKQSEIGRNNALAGLNTAKTDAQEQAAKGPLSDEQVKYWAGVFEREPDDVVKAFPREQQGNAARRQIANYIASAGGDPAALVSGIQDTKINFGAQAKSEKDFATGKQGQQVKSFNVLIDHLHTFDDLIDAMKNGKVQKINALANRIAAETGQTAPTNLVAARALVGDEIVKAVIGAGGALGDRDEAKKSLDGANSPEQLRGVVQTYRKLAGGQLNGLRLQYEETTGKKDFERFLSESAKAELPAPERGASAGFPKVTPDQQAARDTDAKAIREQEAAKERAVIADPKSTPEQKANSQRNLAELEREAGHKVTDTPKRVSTKAEFEALPKGAKFIDARDGKEKVKG